MWTGADGFHRFPKHKPAKKPKLDGAVKKEAPEAASMSRKQSLAAADYSNIKLGPTPLSGMSSKEAAEIYVRRVELEVVGDDNFEEVKADRGKWLRAILDAFDAPYLQVPDTKIMDLEEFQRWQKEHHSMTMEEFEKRSAKKHAEATATHLFHQVVDGHEKGSLLASTGQSFAQEGRLNCKARLENVITAIKRSTIIRYDLVSGRRVTELVAHLVAFFNRKEENKQMNDKKAKEPSKKKAAKKANAEANAKSRGKTATKKVSAAKAKKGKAKTGAKPQTQNKRSGKGKAAVVEDEDESSNDEFDSSARDASTYIEESEPAVAEDAEVDEDYDEDAEESSSD